MAWCLASWASLLPETIPKHRKQVAEAATYGLGLRTSDLGFRIKDLGFWLGVGIWGALAAI